MVTAVLFIVFFVLLVLDVPIALCLGASSVAAILTAGQSLTVVATNTYSGISKTLLLAIPTKQNMFEANSFFRSNLNKKKMDLVFEQFYTICSVVKLLKLNQKIGL